MYRCLLLIVMLTGFAFVAIAQKPDTVAVKSKADSLNRKKDSVSSKPFVPKITKEKIYHPDSTHSPHTAVMRSLMVPGWGQLYNHRWWKVPLIYGGLGLLGYTVYYNQGYYSEYLTIAKYREKGTVPKPGDPYYTEFQNLAAVDSQQINDATDATRRNRDLAILGVLGAWGINVIDAYIDAKFQHSYTMDNNLSMKISPGVIGQPFYAAGGSFAFFPSIKITFTLK